MTPQEFVTKWKPVALTERQAAQEHFGDLCRLLGQQTPIAADPSGNDYAFEKGASRATGGRGWADVWKRGCFAMEYKKRHANLGAALKQLLNYAGALANPPLLLTCDTDRIEITTNWNDLVSTTIVIHLEELLNPEKVQVLRYAFTNPNALKPAKTRNNVTEEAAAQFAELANRLRRQNHSADKVAHFVNQMLFCLFAQDSELFEERLFTKFLRQARRTPAHAESLLRGLFQNMATGGLYGLDRLDWFNGSLFKDDVVLPLDKESLDILEKAEKLNWSAIEPAIFGTLFERGLDPSKRSQEGAHYTDPVMIERIVSAVVTRPLLAEWTEVRDEISRRIAAPQEAKTSAQPRKRVASPLGLFQGLPVTEGNGLRKQAAKRQPSGNINTKALRDRFLDRLRKFKVLDPACGSGNFLYVALVALKDIELQVLIESETLGIPREFPLVGPDCVLGREINSYAIELARVTVWIGEIQWMRRKGYDLKRNPVLGSLNGIEKIDAIKDEITGKEPVWPDADVIVGNPPFLGSRLHLRRLGSDYIKQLRDLYHERIPAGADLVCYWFEKSRAMVIDGRVQRVGLLATKSIANAEANRQVLDRICDDMTIFEARHNLPWVIDGAAVVVSIVCFARNDDKCAASIMLDGRSVKAIRSDLRDADLLFDLRNLRHLEENRNVAFQGVKLAGRRADDEDEKDEDEKGFVIDRVTGDKLLNAGGNPNGRPNSDVICVYWSGDEALGHSRDRLVIDFGPTASETTAQGYAAPYRHLERIVRDRRSGNREGRAARRWWIHQRARRNMREAIAGLERFLVTVEVAKHRFFRWAPAGVLPSGSLVVFARSDDFFMGILESRIHKIWASETHNPLENRPRYRIGHSFESFPFPNGLRPNISIFKVMENPIALTIANRARALYDAREAALTSGLKPLDMTQLYDLSASGDAAWLIAAHRQLDIAVAAAYGWSPDLSNEELLVALGALHHERQGTAINAE